jgi:hypothetical protein
LVAEGLEGRTFQHLAVLAQIQVLLDLQTQLVEAVAGLMLAPLLAVVQVVVQVVFKTLVFKPPEQGLQAKEIREGMGRNIPAALLMQVVAEADQALLALIQAVELGVMAVLELHRL